jgi:hypothetical protein
MDSNVSDWTVGASVFTFAPLMLLFIAVAAALYVVYTKPGTTPGHHADAAERPVIFTPQPGLPAAGPALPSDGPSTAEGAETPAPADKAGE